MISHRVSRGRAVQRVDGFYMYRVGYQLHQLADMRGGGGIFGGMKATTYGEAQLPLYLAESALNQLLYNSVFQIRTSLMAGERMLAAIRDMRGKVAAVPDKNADIEFTELWPLQQELTTFEAVLAAEMAMVPLYIVTRKAAFDTALLIDAGRVIFPEELQAKVPSAIPDIEQGTKCIAFALPTAAGFHFHRANESVLKCYWDAVSAGKPRPASNNMGVYLAAMDKDGVGDDRVKSSLRDLKDYHRNPLIHPEHSLESIDEAVALMNAVQNAVVQMLKAVPDPGP